MRLLHRILLILHRVHLKKREHLVTSHSQNLNIFKHNNQLILKPMVIEQGHVSPFDHIDELCFDTVQFDTLFIFDLLFGLSLQLPVQCVYEVEPHQCLFFVNGRYRPYTRW